MLSSSARHDDQQGTWVVETAAFKVDSRRTGHERIVFLWDKGNKEQKRMSLVNDSSTASMIITHRRLEITQNKGRNDKAPV